MIAVIAGNKRQFDYFIRHDKKLPTNQREYKYIARDEDAHGMEFSDMIFVGEAWKSDVNTELVRDRIRRAVPPAKGE